MGSDEAKIFNEYLVVDNEFRLFHSTRKLKHLKLSNQLLVIVQAYT